MKTIINSKAIIKYVDWFYRFLFYYAEEKETMSKKIKAIFLAVTPILLAMGYIILTGLYFITGG